jgi:hypothetical protein
VPLQILAAEAEDHPSLAELLPDEHTAPPDEALARKNDGEYLGTLLATLPARSRRVLRLRYGLEDGSPRSLEDVGFMLGLARQRVFQIEKASLARLRQRVQLADLLRRGLRTSGAENAAGVRCPAGCAATPAPPTPKHRQAGTPTRWLPPLFVDPKLNRAAPLRGSGRNAPGTLQAV